MPADRSNNARVLIVLVVIMLFGIITFALAAATLGTLNKRFNDVQSKINVIEQRLNATG